MRRSGAYVRDERPPPHSITSSARARSVGWDGEPKAFAALVSVDNKVELGWLLDRKF